MIARKLTGLAIVIAMTAPALAVDDADDARLIAEAVAAQVATEPAEVDADDLRAAQTDAAVANAKLQLVLARKALRSDGALEAVKRAKAALAMLRDVESTDRVEELRLQAEGLLGRLAQRGVDVEAIGAMKSTDTVVVVDEASVAATAQHEDIQYQAALRERTLAQESRRLTQADEARLAPDREVAYPDDWQDRVASRTDNGQVAVGQPWTDNDGRERYIAVYDLSDLTYVPPDFQLNYGFDPYDDLRNAQDREAIRQRSEIFNGYASDLAAGIPLLPYFGGVGDPFMYRGPKYDARRHEQIVEMIRRFSSRSADNVMVSLPPTQ